MPREKCANGDDVTIKNGVMQRRPMIHFWLNQITTKWGTHQCLIQNCEEKRINAVKGERKSIMIKLKENKRRKAIASWIMRI
jgi:hypothetical protein